MRRCRVRSARGIDHRLVSQFRAARRARRRSWRRRRGALRAASLNVATVLERQGVTREHVTRVAGRPSAAPRKPTKWIVFPRRRAPLPGVRGYPGRPADADVDRREYPADSRASRANAGRARRAGGGGAENGPALGDRGGQPDDRPGGDDRDGTRSECGDLASIGEASCATGRSSAASPTGTLSWPLCASDLVA